MNSNESASNGAGVNQAPAALETVEISTGPNPRYSVIWLHGLGADGHDFEPLVPHIAWPGIPDVRYVFPHAPVRPVTVNGGMPMRAWYDILDISSDILDINSERGHDRKGIDQSVRQVSALIDREVGRGMPTDRIVLAGFSQGGAIALQLALRYPEKLCALVALSTYLLHGETLAAEVSPANKKLPVFMAHGTQDPVVPVAMGEAARRQLVALGYPLEWREYPMPHAVSPQEIADLVSWLRQRLG